MTKFERLLDDIEKDNIYFIDSHSTKNPAKTIRDDEGDYGIFMNVEAFRTNAERLVALGHENGHCSTGAVYTIDAPILTREKCEYKANKSATYKLVPINELIDAVENGARTVWELAERFEVTEDFMHFALRVYEEDLRRFLDEDGR